MAGRQAQSERPRKSLRRALGERDTWAAGDLALCVQDGGWVLEAGEKAVAGPDSGALARVTGLSRQDDALYLEFAEWPRQCLTAGSFAKVNPHAADADDLATIAELTGAAS